VGGWRELGNEKFPSSITRLVQATNGRRSGLSRSDCWTQGRNGVARVRICEGAFQARTRLIWQSKQMPTSQLPTFSATSKSRRSQQRRPSVDHC
jgi:hypothetical protein